MVGSPSLRVFCLAFCLSGCEPPAAARVQLDLRPIKAALAEMQLDVLQVEISAPDLETITVPIDPEADTFEAEVPAGDDRRFHLGALAQRGEDLVPAFFGETTADLPPGVTVDIVIRAYPVGVLELTSTLHDVTGRTSVTIGTSAIPGLHDATLLVEADGHVVVRAGPVTLSGGDASIELAGSPMDLTVVQGEITPVALHFIVPGEKCAAAADPAVYDLAPTCRAIQVTVSGPGSLAPGLVLSNTTSSLSSADTLPVASYGAVSFDYGVPDGATYAIGVASAPAGITCTVGGSPSGTVSGADVALDVTCGASEYKITADVRGLVGTGLSLGLYDGAGGDGQAALEVINPTADGAWPFERAFLHGSMPELRIEAMPTDAGALLNQPNCMIFDGDTPITGNRTQRVRCVSGVQPFYANAKGWSQYVAGSGATATAPTCDVPTTGGYGACTHGGEVRVVDVPDLTSCTNVEAFDQLNAFTWTCDASLGTVRIISQGLQPGARFTDLIDWTAIPVYRANPVFIDDGQLVRSTTDAPYWDAVRDAGDTFANEIAVDNVGSAAGPPPPGQITVVTDASALQGYAFTDPNHTLLVKPGVAVGASAASLQVASAFIWVEGDFDGSLFGAGGPVQVSGAEFVVFKGVSISDSGEGSTLALNSTTNSLFEDLDITLSNGNGVELNTGQGITFRRVTTNDCSFHGIGLGSATSEIVLEDITALRNSANGVSLDGTGHVLTNIDARNNVSAGMRIAGSDNRVTGLTVVDNGSIGLHIEGSNNVVRRVTATHNAGEGISISTASSPAQRNTLFDVSVSHNAGAGTGRGIYVNNAPRTAIGLARVFAQDTNAILVSSPVAFISAATLAGSGANGYAYGGVTFDASGSNGYVGNVIAVNDEVGLHMSYFSNGPLLGDNVALLNNDTGIAFDGYAPMGLHGELVVGNGVDCDGPFPPIAYSWEVFADDTCAPGSEYIAPAPTLTAGQTAAGAFVGKVADMDNLHGGVAQPTRASAGAITDWSTFENPYRGWMSDSTDAPFPDATQRRACTGTCQVFDWRLASGSILADVVATPPGAGDTGLHGTLSCLSQIDCPAGINCVDGFCQTPFLKHAIEIIGSGGNDNLLCEGGEHCLFTPHFGAYQGEGGSLEDLTTLQELTPVTMPGPSTVRLYRFPTSVAP